MKTHETCSINQNDDWGPVRIMEATFHPQCPNEGELLAFYERDVSSWKRFRIEKHLAECESCRESIAMMVTLSRTQDQGRHEDLGIVGEDLIRSQTARIVAMAGDDEVRRSRKTEIDGAGRLVPGRPRTVFGIPISSRLMVATAVFVFILLAVPVVFWMQLRPSPTLQAMQALAAAVQPGRNSEAVVSKVPYSHYTALRGATDRDSLMYDRAASKVDFAKKSSESTEARHTLARVLLARNAGNDPQTALEILNDIASKGVSSAEVLNDLGVAQFELSRFDEAIANFTKALQRSPGFREALFNRAVAEKANAQYTEASRSFTEFLNTNPEGDWRAEAESNLRTLNGLSPSER